MTEVNQESVEKSPWFYILSGLAIVFFLLAFTGAGLLAYILWKPYSGLANALLAMLSIGQGANANLGLGSVIDLLIGAVGATGSLSLSLALAAIYLSQNQILDTQTDIQRSQTKIMNRQKLPMVAAHESGIQLHEGRATLEEIDSDGTLCISTKGSGPYVSVAVENHGEEAAEQVQLACLVDVPSVDEPQIHTGVAELTVDGMFTKPPRGEGALLPPTKDLALLRGTPLLSSSPTTVKETIMFVGGIADQLRELRSDESDEETANESSNRVVRFGFVLIFTNSANQTFMIPLESAYSVRAKQFADSEDVTLTALGQKSVVYDIDDLIKDIEWSISEEAFEER